MIWPDDYINKVICGDCFEVMKGIPDGVVDCVVTDPPYNLDLHNSSGRMTGVYRGRETNVFHEIEKASPRIIDPSRVLEESKRVLKSFIGYFWCGRRQVPEYLNWAIAQGYYFDILAWCKSNPMPLNNNSLLSDIEYGVQIRENGATHNTRLPFQMYSKHFYSSRINGINHPTPKPVGLMNRHIMVSSPLGGIILDPFAGSGTTLVAAKQLGREYIGIEINSDYCKIAKERLSQEELQI